MIDFDTSDEELLLLWESDDKGNGIGGRSHLNLNFLTVGALSRLYVYKT